MENEFSAQLLFKAKSLLYDSPSPSSTSSAAESTNKGLTSLLGGDQPLLRLSKDGPPGSFYGLFVFGFDEKGKIVSRAIEHADESNGYDKTAEVTSLTDWLLGKAKESVGKKEPHWVLTCSGMETGEWKGWDRNGAQGPYAWERRGK